MSGHNQQVTIPFSLLKQVVNGGSEWVKFVESKGLVDEADRKINIDAFGEAADILGDLCEQQGFSL